MLELLFEGADETPVEEVVLFVGFTEVLGVEVEVEVRSVVASVFVSFVVVLADLTGSVRTRLGAEKSGLFASVDTPVVVDTFVGAPE